MTTDERLENLEKGLASARRLNRWLLAAVGLALGVWMLAGTFGPATAGAPAAGGVAKEVRANRFVVEDENGKVRASLGMVKETEFDLPTQPEALRIVGTGPRLELFAENGKVRARLASKTLSGGWEGDPARLTLFDDNDKPRAILSAVHDFGPMLLLCDAAGGGQAVLELVRKCPRLRLIGGTGKPGAVLSVDDYGAGLGLFDAAGRSRMSVGAHRVGSLSEMSSNLPARYLMFLFDEAVKGSLVGPVGGA